jgi:VWFA-related protein
MTAAQTWFRPLAAAALLTALAVPAAAQQQPFTERTDVVVVEVPVQVVKDGEPVRGLTAADFEVFDGRKKQEIVGFEVLDLYAPGATQGAVAAVPAAARRHFLLLFDLSFSEPKSILKAQDAVKNLLGTLHPSDLVAVSTYSLSKGPQLALGFTTDRAQIRAAISTLGVPELIDRSPDPLRLVLSEAIAEGPSGERGTERQQEMGAAKYEALVETLEEIATASGRANRTNQQESVTAMTRSFSDLAKLMGAVEGRKHVVYLSEGFDSSVITGTYDQARQDAMSEQSISGEGYMTDSDERFGNSKTGNAVEKMLEEFRRADCVIQSVDIGGIRAGADQAPRRANGKEGLLAMAKGTGGELYENFNDLSVAMDQMLKRTGVTYVLAIQPEKLKADGSYRRLKVELKNAPRGTRVVHRPGYYSPRSYAEQSPLEKLLATANQVTSGEESGTIRASVLAAPFQAAGDKAYVPVLVEVDGPTLLAGKQGPQLPIEVYIYAMDSSGAVHDFLTQTMGLDLTKAETALRQGGFKFFGHVDLLPGDYSLRVLVRNSTTGASALRVVDVKVPKFAPGGVVLLPPFFPEPAGRWLMARETLKPGAPQVPYPFMQKDQPYVPAARPVLGNGQAAAVSLVGYGLAAGDLKADARVLTRDGKDVGPGTLKVLGREGGGSGGGGGPDRLAATFEAPSLQPGEYLLRVTLTDGAGKSETSAIPFVVGGAGKGASG